MSSSNAKHILIALIISLFMGRAFALPGVEQYIPDSSGEYIYDADYSFQRTSFVGFIYYDETTYALRYYSPADLANHQFEKDITLYFAVDPSKKNLTLLGEKIIGETATEDKDIINYMHDLFYEFTARRQKVTVIGKDKIQSNESFAQFGGDVTITYSNVAPIFNIESIRALDGTVLFRMQSTGQLSSSTDTSFLSFKGVEGLPKDKVRTFTAGKEDSERSVYGSQSILLDSEWSQSMENLWFRGNEALLSLNEIPSAPQEQELYETFLCRKLCQGTNGSYSISTQTRIELTGNTIKITAVHYQPKDQNVTRDFNIITRRSDGSYAYIKLTVFDALYQENKDYFTKLLDSYRAD